MKKIFAIFIALLSILGASNYAAALELNRQTADIIAPALFIPVPPADGIAEIDISELTLSEADTTARRLSDYASKYLGTRYVWGATGPKSFDCSGFIGHVFRNEGISLPRTSRMQYTRGTKVSKSDLRPGDLLFFSSRTSGKGRVGHVAMVTEVNPDGSCVFIHASTKRGVVYQKFPDGGYYSRHFIGAKRLI